MPYTCTCRLIPELIVCCVLLQKIILLTNPSTLPTSLLLNTKQAPRQYHDYKLYTKGKYTIFRDVQPILAIQT